MMRSWSGQWEIVAEKNILGERLKDDALRSRLSGPHMGQGAMLALGTVQPDTYKTFTFTFLLPHPPDKMCYLSISFRYHKLICHVQRQYKVHLVLFIWNTPLDNSNPLNTMKP